jgi:tetratricopeptide (TPR) repeat protein
MQWFWSNSWVVYVGALLLGLGCLVPANVMVQQATRFRSEAKQFISCYKLDNCLDVTKYKAWGYYQSVRRLRHVEPSVYHVMGLIQYSMGNLRNALNYMHIALKQEQNPLYYYNLAFIYASLGQEQKARQYLLKYGEKMDKIQWNDDKIISPYDWFLIDNQFKQKDDGWQRYHLALLDYEHILGMQSLQEWVQQKGFRCRMFLVMPYQTVIYKGQWVELI